MVNTSNMLIRDTPCQNCGSCEAKLIYEFSSGNYVKCIQCDLVSVEPLPGYDQMLARSKFWASEHHKKDVKVKQHYSREFQNFAFKEYFEEMSSYKRTGKVLDIGCGIGSFIHAAERRGWDAYGVDIGPSISIAKKHNLKVYEGRLQDVWFPENYFDVLTMFDVIEHIYNLDDLFISIKEKLRRNGLLVIKTPNFNSISSKLLGRNWSAVQPLDHVTLFSKKTLRSYLGKRGFSTIESRTIDINIFGLVNFFIKSYNEHKEGESEISKRTFINKLTNSKSLQIARNLLNFLLISTNLGESLIVYARLD